MKIVKKAKLPKITCELCGCVFRPDKSDLRSFARDSADMKCVREGAFTACPTCGLSARVFVKEWSEDAEAQD